MLKTIKAKYKHGIFEPLERVNLKDGIEVNLTIDNYSEELSEEEKVIRMARDLGFKVYGEVGKKFSEGDKTRKGDSMIDLKETIDEMKSCLSAGAEHVYWEGHVLRRLMGETPQQILERQKIFEPIFSP